MMSSKRITWTSIGLGVSEDKNNHFVITLRTLIHNKQEGMAIYQTSVHTQITENPLCIEVKTLDCDNLFFEHQLVAIKTHFPYLFSEYVGVMYIQK